jgi:hypothetical protein
VKSAMHPVLHQVGQKHRVNASKRQSILRLPLDFAKGATKDSS